MSAQKFGTKKTAGQNRRPDFSTPDEIVMQR
jgi:hypothetical protein